MLQSQCPQERIFNTSGKINIPQINMHTTALSNRNHFHHGSNQHIFGSAPKTERKKKKRTHETALGVFDAHERSIVLANGETEVSVAVEMSVHNFIGSSLEMISHKFLLE